LADFSFDSDRAILLSGETRKLTQVGSTKGSTIHSSDRTEAMKQDCPLYLSSVGHSRASDAVDQRFGTSQLDVVNRFSSLYEIVGRFLAETISILLLLIENTVKNVEHGNHRKSGTGKDHGQ
jgi:hypothetical protein